jgi:hypothetical protein
MIMFQFDNADLWFKLNVGTTVPYFYLIIIIVVIVIINIIIIITIFITSEKLEFHLQ